jgi:hypothetical protein
MKPARVPLDSYFKSIKKWLVVTVILSAMLFLVFHLVPFLNSPVYRWADYYYDERGDFYFYECASPTWWDKIINSSEWQKWEEWEKSIGEDEKHQSDE